MSPVVFFLTIIGICLIIASFIFFDKDETLHKKQVVMLNDYELDEQELAKLQESIRVVVKEYSDQLITDTNQQLSSVSSQKMMEISELAEQVLEDIKKNHKECVFLYDMLEDKSENLKQYVSNSAEKLFAMQKDVMRVLPEEDKGKAEEVLKDRSTQSQIQEYLVEQVKQLEGNDAPDEDMEGVADVQERNRLILDMVKDGKEPLEIARELDLGVGEVQLVVDLFQGE
ncbi:MAG: hypothetical protein J6D02_03655 [Lachnospira sp.]|nr:hypothetical protein [Lachnospira sp.]